jgi:two-component system, LuxR family, sensor kinase FixL
VLPDQPGLSGGPAPEEDPRPAQATPHPSGNSSFPIVGVGASAGLEAFLNRLAEVPRLEIVRDWELTVVAPHGEAVDVSLTVTTSRGREGKPESLRWLLRNGEPWKRALQALRAQKSFADGLVNKAPTLVLVLDRAGRILWVNPYLEWVCGYRWAELQGRDWQEALAPEPSAPRELLAAARHEGPVGRITCTIATRDGGQRTVEWSARALQHSNGATPAVLVIGHDITALKEAQDQALRVERLAAIGEMMAGLAHESRNALQRSQACLERLRWQLQDRPEALDLVSRLQTAQEDLVRLYEDVRGYAAPIRLDVKPCDVGAAWREAWEALAPQRQGRDAALEEETAGTDLGCRADRFRLGQVFRNVFENALAAGPDPVRVTIACAEETLNNRPALRVAVRDSGPGLTPEQRQRIFEPFYTTKTHGSGLGMSIARRIVEAHDGQISVGDPEAGAEIVLTLPRNAP